MLTIAPPDCAYSAAKKFVCILNSCTASTEGVHFRSVAPVFCSVVLTMPPSTRTSDVELSVLLHQQRDGGLRIRLEALRFHAQRVFARRQGSYNVTAGFVGQDGVRYVT